MESVPFVLHDAGGPRNELNKKPLRNYGGATIKETMTKETHEHYPSARFHHLLCSHLHGKSSTLI